MTDFAISEQIEAINNATRKALKSQKSARKFLFDAGIISSDKVKENKIVFNNSSVNNLKKTK